MSAHKILQGDCIEVLKTLPDDSLDSCVCDPPYGLEFMGKSWDKFKTGRASKYKSGGHLAKVQGIKGFSVLPSYVNRPAKRCAKCGKQKWSGSPCKCANPKWILDNSPLYSFQEFCEAWAREVLRVLKPGAHLLAFSGTRTYHRMVCAIEDAGFEIRDQIGWLYGSGFPKSLDVSKAIDKRRDDSKASSKVARFLLRFAKGRGVSEFREFLNWKIVGEKHGGGSAQGWTTTRTNAVVKPRVPTWKQWLQLKKLLSLSDEMDAEVWRLNGRKGEVGDAWNEAEILGEHNGSTPGFVGKRFSTRDNKLRRATPAAQQWDGWGTALKPAWEPIVVARKPLIGTVAQNVLRFGTGAINVDGSRVGTEQILQYQVKRIDGGAGVFVLRQQPRQAQNGTVTKTNGRSPANVIHDGSDEVLAEFAKFGEKTSNSGNLTFSNRHHGVAFGKYQPCKTSGISDTGTAARFFYCAKASKRDRDEGLNGFAAKIKGAAVHGFASGDLHAVNLTRKDKGPSNRQPQRNNHPTVKPTALMRYLVRLVTPPKGTVLDCFAGSGSTGKAARLEGFKFIGIEREAEYVKIANARIKAVAA